MRCSKCKKPKRATAFYKKASNKSGYDSRCKKCVSEYFHGRRQTKKQNGFCGCGKRPRAGYSVCAACLKRRQVYDRKLKQDAVDAYGGRCLCPCGCTVAEFEFLTIDHPEGKGTQHRKETGGGYHFYKWLRKRNYPKGYRVLCWNCNCSRGMYGFCPREAH